MSNRTVRINELLQREISHLLHTRFSKEAVLYTITGVDIAADLRTAKVYFTVLPKGTDLEAARLWLGSKVPAIAEHLRKHVQLRYLPKMEFVHDEAPDRAERVLRLLDEIARPPSP